MKFVQEVIVKGVDLVQVSYHEQVVPVGVEWDPVVMAVLTGHRGHDL